MVKPNEVNHDYEKDFQAYTEVLRPINDVHPQHNGLLFDEFVHALEHRSTVISEPRTAVGQVKLPRLVVPEMNGWLHADFYKTTFPADSEKEQILHYTELPPYPLGDHVVTRLKELAQHEGVLLFDYPGSDAEYFGRLGLLLNNVGIEFIEPTLLGTQTYHVGRSRLKRDHEHKSPHQSYVEAFEEIVETGNYDTSKRKNGVWVHRIIDDEDAERLQEFYDAAYETISDHPCEQGLTPNEFGKKLLQPTTAKAVYRREGVAESLCLVTEDLSDLTWVNEGYYQSKEFRDRFGEGAITWYPGIATDPNSMGRNMPKIISLFARLCEVGDNEHIVVFDTPDANTGFLDVALDGLINRSKEVEINFTRIAEQKYYATRLKNIS